MAQLKSELFRDKLQTRTRGKSESLPELAQSIKKLTIKVITKLPNSEQSYKGKVQTHNYINRQNQSTTENCENRNDPDLVQAFLKKWWVESDFKAPNLPLSLRFKGYPSAQSSLTSGLALEHFIDAIPDGNLRLRLRESNPKSIHQAETLAVRLETLKLAERQKGCMVRQTDSVKGHLNNSSLEVQNVNNEKGERLKEFKDEFSEFRKDLIS
jgi:hypothetical protein